MHLATYGTYSYLKMTFKHARNIIKNVDLYLCPLYLWQQVVNHESGVRQSENKITCHNSQRASLQYHTGHKSLFTYWMMILTSLHDVCSWSSREPHVDKQPQTHLCMSAWQLCSWLAQRTQLEMYCKTKMMYQLIIQLDNPAYWLYRCSNLVFLSHQIWVSVAKLRTYI